MRKFARPLTLRYENGVLVAALAGPCPYFGEQPREGDVIYAVGRQRVTSVETLRTALDGLSPGQPIVLQAERAGSLRFLVLEND